MSRYKDKLAALAQDPARLAQFRETRRRAAARARARVVQDPERLARRREYQRAYYSQDPARVRAYAARRARSTVPRNPREIAARRAYQRAYYAKRKEAMRDAYLDDRAARLAYQRAYYQRNREARLAYQRAYVEAQRTAETLASELASTIETRRAARRAYQRDYYQRNSDKRRAYAHTYRERRRAARPPKVTPPPRVPRPPAEPGTSPLRRRDATRDPIGALHARLVALAPAYAWRIYDGDVRGRDGKVKLRALVSGVIYVGAERKNLKKWLQSIGVSGEIAL